MPVAGTVPNYVRFKASFPDSVLAWPTSTDMQMALSTYVPMKISTGVGVLDAMVAATAVGRGLPVATFNQKHFVGLSGVAVVQPYFR